MELTGHIAGVRAGTTDPAVLLGEFRRTVVLAPVLEGGFLSATMGGIRWVYAFTDAAQLRRFAAARGDTSPGAAPPGDTSPGAAPPHGAGTDGPHGEPVVEVLQHRGILGARLLDVVIPALGTPAGVALDVADAQGSMLFPPVHGVVPDAVAVPAAAAMDGPRAAGSVGQAPAGAAIRGGASRTGGAEGAR